MTNEDAVKNLKFMAMNLTGELATETNQHDQRYLGETLEAVDAAIDALERQTPKKPIWHVLSKYKNGNVKKGAWKCPSCLRIEYVKRRDALDTYCGFCGQKIDYEGVEE